MRQCSIYSFSYPSVYTWAENQHLLTTIKGRHASSRLYAIGTTAISQHLKNLPANAPHPSVTAKSHTFCRRATAHKKPTARSWVLASVRVLYLGLYLQLFQVSDSSVSMFLGTSSCALWLYRLSTVQKYSLTLSLAYVFLRMKAEEKLPLHLLHVLKHR